MQNTHTQELVLHAGTVIKAHLSYRPSNYKLNHRLTVPAYKQGTELYFSTYIGGKYTLCSINI